MTPRQVPAQTAAAPEGRLFPLLGAALGLALLWASLWAAGAYRSAMAAEGGPQRGPLEQGPAEALDPGGGPAAVGAPGRGEPRADGPPAGAVEPEPQVE